MKNSFLISLAFGFLFFGFANNTMALSCESPYVEYNGQCVDPIPACQNPPENSMPSTCIDKIENGERISRYSFSCIPGYTKEGSECINNCPSPEVPYNGVCSDPIPACQNPPANVMPSTCIDKIEGLERIERYSFSCLDGYKKVDKECVKENNCESPYVEYNGQCVDPIPACKTPIVNSTSCIDKIENGQYIEHYSFNCLPGYEKTSNACIGSDKCKVPFVEYQGKCVDPIPPCSSWPSNAVTCIDKIEDGQRISRYSFQCQEGFVRSGNYCVAKSTYKPTQTANTQIPPAGFEDEVIVNTEAYQNPFPDTNTAYDEGKAAAELYRRGVIGGYPDGEFKGSREVNRAEAAKFLLLAKLGKVDELKNTGRFSDVVEGQWYVKFIIKAANLGVIEGYSDGNFRPQNTVNTAEFLKMLTKVFNLEENLSYTYSDINSSDWFAKYAGTAQKYMLFPHRSTQLNPAKNMTRDEVAVAIYQYLKNR